MVLPIIDLEKTGQNIKEMRTRVGLSVRDVQAVMGFTNPTAIYKWEQGVTLPKIDNLVILSALLEVPIQEIIAIRVGG